jgi:chemotaxis signal transduction protein
MELEGLSILFRYRDVIFCIGVKYLVEILQGQDYIDMVTSRNSFIYKDREVPIVLLSKILRIYKQRDSSYPSYVVILGDRKYTIAMPVDGIDEIISLREAEKFDIPSILPIKPREIYSCIYYSKGRVVYELNADYLLSCQR